MPRGSLPTVGEMLGTTELMISPILQVMSSLVSPLSTAQDGKLEG